MKLVTVVGARPQFIKAAAVSRQITKYHEEIIIHTGQHYDKNMSQDFFDELSIPTPKYNLNVGSASHAHQTADMLKGIEDILLSEKPDAVLVYGDTNSTLAGALAASKLLIPVIHIEAGLRSFNMAMPEEQNRILTDHISKYLFCSTDVAVNNLKNEGITKNVYLCGDVMCDAVMIFSAKSALISSTKHVSHLIPVVGNIPDLKTWYLATIHRAENTDDIEKIREILNAFDSLKYPVLFPVHPRTVGLIKRLTEKRSYPNIVFTEPMGYLDMLYFTLRAQAVITDSGGLQKEAYIMKTPCVTVRDQTEWTETLLGGWNVLTSPKCEDIISKVSAINPDDKAWTTYYGKGDASEKMVEILNGLFK